MTIKNILLVEDDASIRSIAIMSLERVGGFSVTYAASGLEALDILSHNTFDVVLLDIMMPDLDGFETCRRMKADPKLQNIPVIFLTAKAQAQEVQYGLGLGAIGYVIKPFDPMTLPREIIKIVEAQNHELKAA